MDPIQQQQQPQIPQQPDPEQVLQATNSALIKKKQLAQTQENNSYSPAQISQAMAQVAPNSPAGKVGKAIATPSYAGFCQQFVDDSVGTSQRYATASATWQAKVQSGEAQTDVSKAKIGDVIEFAPDDSNQNMGHAAIITKDGLKMATDNGIKVFSLKDWTKYTGQTPSGFYTPSKS